MKPRGKKKRKKKKKKRDSKVELSQSSKALFGKKTRFKSLKKKWGERRERGRGERGGEGGR